jgi:ribosomal protein S18 acetylase RimI-like enzyme
VDQPLNAPGPHIRPYQADDLAALYEICLRTGDAGGDATALVDDRRLFGELYAAPYAALEPQHALVLDDGTGRAVGYVLAALDTCAFQARCEAEWWPALRARHPLPGEATTLDDLLVQLIHQRPRRGSAVLTSHPSHLHIDLLPEVQSAGWGRRLMAALFERLRAGGSPGVHWGVSTRNHRAIGFYRHVGADELEADAITITFGVRLGPSGGGAAAIGSHP